MKLNFKPIFVVGLSLLAFHCSLFAQQDSAMKKPVVITYKQMDALCTAFRMPNETGFECDNIRYFTEELLNLEGYSCIELSASKKQMHKILSEIWKKYYSKIECEPDYSPHVNFPASPVLDHALWGTYEEFFNIMREDYGEYAFDLNVTDKDGNTVVDWLEEQTNSATIMKPRITELLHILKTKGAKHSWELYSTK